MRRSRGASAITPGSFRCLSRPPFARVPVRSQDVKDLMTLFPLEDIDVPEEPSQEDEPGLEEYVTETGLETPYLNQLRRVFSY